MSSEYLNIANSINATFAKEMLKHEKDAIKMAIQTAKINGLSDEEAQVFVQQLLDKKRRKLHKDIVWKKL